MVQDDRQLCRDGSRAPWGRTRKRNQGKLPHNLDSTCVLIGLQVYFLSAMKHDNNVIDMVGCLQVVRIYSFMEEIKLCIRASYIVFFFFKTENNNFIKEIKHVFRAFISCSKPQQSSWYLSGRWKPSTASPVFTDLLSNSSIRSPTFSPGLNRTRTSKSLWLRPKGGHLQWRYMSVNFVALMDPIKIICGRFRD